MAVKQQGNELIFEGIAYYAQVFKPSQFGVYKVDVVVDDETAADLRKIGIKVASSVAGEDELGNKIYKAKVYEDHPGKVFSFKRKTHTKAGVEMTPPTVVGPDLQPFSKKIGNGSKVKLKIGLYPTRDAQGKELQGAGLNAMQVIEHKEFVQDSPTGGSLSGFTAVAGCETSTDFDAVDF